MYSGVRASFKTNKKLQGLDGLKRVRMSGIVALKKGLNERTRGERWQAF